MLSVGGEVQRQLIFHYQDLLRMPSKDMMFVLECSGNNRGHFQPRVFGEQWEGGAISQGVWRGVALRDLLKLTGILATAKEIVFEGYDYGKRTDLEGEFVFVRSLPLNCGESAGRDWYLNLGWIGRQMFVFFHDAQMSAGFQNHLIDFC